MNALGRWSNGRLLSSLPTRHILWASVQPTMYSLPRMYKFPESFEILMFVCSEKDGKQCYDVRKAHLIDKRAYTQSTFVVSHIVYHIFRDKLTIRFQQT